MERACTVEREGLTEDFYSDEAKAFLAEVYKDPGEIRKYVFGEITCVWVKKQ